MSLGFYTILFVSFLISLSLTYCLIRKGEALGLLDFPNHRRLHTKPTPRGGGLAFIVSFLLGSFFLVQLNALPFIFFETLILAGLPIAIIGLVDDFFHSPILIRLIIQLLSAILVLWFFQGMPTLELGFITWHWGLIGWPIGILGLIWMANFYNFMDGMDGLAASQGIFVALNISILLLLKGEMILIPALLLLSICIFAFLIWNFPPAKIFMGDCGSNFLGFVFGIFLVFTVKENLLTPWQWLIIFSSFWIDATWTLVRRIIQKENGTKLIQIMLFSMQFGYLEFLKYCLLSML
jgi:Fuc2NAc and GlcNAc transferase